MMSGLRSVSVERINALREKLPFDAVLTAGIDDPYSPKTSGDILHAVYVDDIGQIHGSWESGGSMAIDAGVDSFIVTNEKGGN